jgi:hypothetical protein
VTRLAILVEGLPFKVKLPINRLVAFFDPYMSVLVLTQHCTVQLQRAPKLYGYRHFRAEGYYPNGFNGSSLAYCLGPGLTPSSGVSCAPLLLSCARRTLEMRRFLRHSCAHTSCYMAMPVLKLRVISSKNLFAFDSRSKLC